MNNNTLILLDESLGSAGVLDQSYQLFGNTTDNHFTCAFVEGITQKQLRSIFNNDQLLNNQYSYKDIFSKVMSTQDLLSVDDLSYQFIKTCEEHGVKAKVYSGENENSGIIEDSRFYDLMIIPQNLISGSKKNTVASETVEAILHKAECPLLLLNKASEPFKNIIILFDGTERSIEAIKMFAYLMGDHLKKHRVILNTVINENTIIHEKQVCEYLKMYQPFFAIHRIYPENYYSDLLKLLRDTDEFLLVSGISRNDLIEDLIFNQHHSFFLEGNRSIFMY